MPSTGRLYQDVRPRARGYDPVGAVAITVALVLLIGAIVQAPQAGWTSTRAIGLIAGGAVLMGVFIVVERRSAAPLVPLRVLRSRLLVGGNLTMALFAMTAWGMSVTLSEYAQDVLGFSPLRFGIGTAVMTVMAVVGADAAQVAGALSAARLTEASRNGFATSVIFAVVGLGAALLLLGPSRPRRDRR